MTSVREWWKDEDKEPEPVVPARLPEEALYEWLERIAVANRWMVATRNSAKSQETGRAARGWPREPGEDG